MAKKVAGELYNAIEGKFSFGKLKTILVSKTSDIVKFIGKGWATIEEDCDPRSLELTKINLADFLFETCLMEGESRITGEEKLRRLKAKPDFVRFDGNVFFGFWEDWKAKKENSALEELYRTQGIEYLDFFGTILLSPLGFRSVLYFFRGGSGKWSWYYRCLADDWGDDDFSAGCASSPA